jgi:biopolymer transport protein ExbD
MRIGVLTCLLVAGAGLSASCLSPVMRFGGGKSAKEAQHETMSDLAPVQLETAAKWTGEITTRKIRVWADNQYRAQNVQWRRSFEAPLELTNLVLTSLLGLRLEPEYQEWERHAPGSTIATDLEALAERDPGRGVLLVVGLTSSLPLVSATFDELGYAQVGGRHLIVRGYADLEERKLYADAFRDLLPEERELSLEQRRHHKTAVVLLHEIGHNFGYEHDAGQDTIMSAFYSHRASSFSAQARDVMLRSLEQRLGRGSSTGESREPTAQSQPQPQPQPQPRASARTQRVVFYVTPSGDVELDGKVVDEHGIDSVLRDAFARDRNTEVLIRRSRKAPSSATAKLVDRATAVGLKVSIAIY